MHTENINLKKTMLVIAFFLLMDNGISYSFWKTLEKFHNLLRFRAPLSLFDVDKVQEIYNPYKWQFLGNYNVLSLLME